MLGGAVTSETTPDLSTVARVSRGMRREEQELDPLKYGYSALVRGKHLSYTTCLPQVFFNRSE